MAQSGARAILAAMVTIGGGEGVISREQRRRLLVSLLLRRGSLPWVDALRMALQPIPDHNGNAGLGRAVARPSYHQKHTCVL